MDEPPLHVLLVEDDAADARFVELLLAEVGQPGVGLHRVDRVAGACRWLREHAVDVVLLDLNLPDSYGLATLERLLAAAPEVPVVVLTGYDSEELALASMRAGAEDFLPKSEMDGEALLRAIRHARERRRHGRIANRSVLMERVTGALAAALTPQQVAEVAVREALAAAGADAAVLLLLDDARLSLDRVDAVGLPDAGCADWERIPVELPSPLADAMERRGLVVVDDREELRRRYPSFAASAGSACAGTLAALPLVADERAFGVLVLCYTAARALTVETAEFLGACIGKCALALDRARLYEREQLAHAQAEHATRLRDEVLGIVAHDLRNPLSVISTYAALLAEGSIEPPRVRESADAILSAARQMEKLIRDLLDVSRIEAGGLDIEATSVSAETLLREAGAALEPLAAERGLRMELHPPGGAVRVRADRERVLQVLSNLIANAIHFTESGGSIALRAEPLGAEVLFLVSDTGCGVEIEHQPHLFDRFWQARRTRRGGAGLGLAIAKGIVERHGGRIGVESQPGAGSTFFFTLPADAAPAPAPPAAAPAAAPTREDNGAGRAEPVRVLIVDDHPIVRRGLKEQLRRARGFDVVGEAATGEEAVRLARAMRPDVVLMDLAMPGIGGIEATRQIVAAEPEVKVLALTGEQEADLLLPVLEAGGHGFVRKTTAHEDLLAALEAALRDEVFLYPSGNRLLLHEFHARLGPPDDGPTGPLTEHERRVLALAAEGYTSAEIGRKLFLSPKTVDTYRSRVMRKLGLGSRPELVRFAVRAGLLRAHSDRD